MVSAFVEDLLVISSVHVLNIDDFSTDKFVSVSSLELTIKLNHALLKLICVITEQNVTKVIVVFNKVIEVIPDSLLLFRLQVSASLSKVLPRVNDCFKDGVCIHSPTCTSHSALNFELSESHFLIIIN